MYFLLKVYCGYFCSQYAVHIYICSVQCAHVHTYLDLYKCTHSFLEPLFVEQMEC